MPLTYDIGDDVILQGVYTVNGAPTNPTAAVCKVAQPDGSEVTVTVAQISTGVYEGTFTPTQSGQHWYRFTGTGAAKAAGESYFQVRKQRVP